LRSLDSPRIFLFENSSGQIQNSRLFVSLIQKRKVGGGGRSVFYVSLTLHLGALDLALATADKEGVKYVLAQDPDSDRFSAAEKR
jgi:hypothetical protein